VCNKNYNNKKDDFTLIPLIVWLCISHINHWWWLWLCIVV
jgi:hypothetical protein